MEKLHPQTGPVTDTGKEISSRNALTHGGTSEKLIVPGERQEDFDALLNNLLEEYSPETPGARNLVEDAALARWFLWRRQRAFNSVESALYAEQADPAAWPPEAFHKLALLDRYKTAAERSLTRVLQNLSGLRRAKKQQVQSKLAIARATAALEQHDREQWKKACQGFDRPTLVQKIFVRVRRGETVTTMMPATTNCSANSSAPSTRPSKLIAASNSPTASRPSTTPSPTAKTIATKKATPSNKLVPSRAGSPPPPKKKSSPPATPSSAMTYESKNRARK
ncbi:MAG TPA: hypothetical protein VH369_19840 [Bryobacteraceae bacterium]